MYEEFFGLNRRPFTAVPYADDFVPVAPLQDALDAVIHCVSQARGIAIVTSQPGMGKTMLCKRMASLLRQDYRSIYLNGAGIETRRALLQAVLFELGSDYVGLSEQEARLQLFQAARHSQTNGRGLLLIVDEAHLISVRLFEELRTLSDYAPEGNALIRVVLCGPFELEEKLADPALTAFNQRVGVQVSLSSLTLQDSARVIHDRLQACGGTDVLSIVSERALELICRASDGNLRCLTQLTDHSLLLAFALEQRPVQEKTVRAALDDLKELPLRWNEIPPSLDVPVASESSNIHDDDAPPQRVIVYSPADLETDEFEIPDFLRADSDSVLDETESHSDAAQSDSFIISSAAPLPSEPEPQYAVFETGAEEEEETAHAPVLTAMDSSPITMEEIQSIAMAHGPVMPVPQSPETDMLEIPVVDRYTLLDRYLELPEDRRGSVDFSQLDNASNWHVETEPEAEDIVQTMAFPQRAPVIEGDAVIELQILDAIHRIRRDVLGQIEQVTQTGITASSQQGFDVVLPEAEAMSTLPFSSSGAEEVKTATAPPVASPTASAEHEGRFSQLFTRLRSRRRRIESEQSGN
ncbi:ExeA family protein [Planctomicrobium piriforme]|uniref:Type II secretory pathway, component ExeA (Predicted ATPase) n=1 Tax=Planctomicrobium piriforme TaxID=1576369 RepID=A0A1I3GPE5_9PLAN|nr:AAA family ATPase [Planctomicrobium piriforme]SFI25314.1 Type II secretory pathway, component ExeA (predicted ATPase) [Planctomicrobium piriforme]